MRAKARIVQFSPDPFSWSRFTVGAFVAAGDRVKFVRAPLIPDAGCLGGHTLWTTMNLTLDALAASNDFDQRSGAVSQLASVGPAIDVPAGVADAVEWVSKALLPHRSDVAEATSHPKRERRDSLGYAMLESWGVAKLVEKRFHIEQLLGAHDARLNHRPSHFVRAGTEILLMEPFVGNRPSLEHELIEVKESFLAHQRLFQVSGQQYAPAFVAYVAPRGYRGAMSEVSDALRPTGAKLVNVDDPQQRDEFVDSIRGLSRKASPELPLV